MASERNTTCFGINFKKFKNSHEYLFETFQIPVLVNNGMDYSRKEDLLCLVSQEIHEIVHFVNVITIFKILHAPLWK